MGVRRDPSALSSSSTCTICFVHFTAIRHTLVSSLCRIKNPSGFALERHPFASALLNFTQAFIAAGKRAHPILGAYVSLSQCFNPHKFYQSQCLLIRLCSLLLVLCSLFIRKPKPVLLHRLHYRFARAQPLPRDRRSLRPFRLIPVKQACFSPQSAYIRFVRCTSFGCGLTPGYTLFLCVSTHFSISYCLLTSNFSLI